MRLTLHRDATCGQGIAGSQRLDDVGPMAAIGRGEMRPHIGRNAQVQVVLPAPAAGIWHHNTGHETQPGRYSPCSLFSATGIRAVRIHASRRHTGRVKIIDEMLSLNLLSKQQHREIASWLRTAGTPEAVMAMPPHLWRAIEVASVAMNIDADLTRPPWLGADLA